MTASGELDDSLRHSVDGALYHLNASPLSDAGPELRQIEPHYRAYLRDLNAATWPERRPEPRPALALICTRPGFRVRTFRLVKVPVLNAPMFDGKCASCHFWRQHSRDARPSRVANNG